MPHAPAVDTVQYWTGYIPSPNINAMPRFGVAVRLSDSTVLRASWAMIYAPYSAEILDAQMLGNALILPSFSVTPQMTAATNSTQSDAPVFPNTYSWFGGPPSASRNSFFAIHKMRIPHSDQEMLAIEHSFDPSTSFTASAIVSRGYSLWNVYDLNLATPARGANYGFNNAAGQNVGLFSTPVFTAVTDTNYAHIYNVDNGDSSWYAGLTAQFKRRISQNFSVEADYTWSHAIDDVGNPIGGLAGAASV